MVRPAAVSESGSTTRSMGPAAAKLLRYVAALALTGWAMLRSKR